MSGIISAFNVEDGRLLWQKPEQLVHPRYHTAMSPVVDGDLVIFHTGGNNNGALTAYDVETGEIRWTLEGDGPSYGSPMVFNLAGVRQVVTFTQSYLVGVSVLTGELLWQRPFRTSNDTAAQTPILHGNTVIEAGRGNGITAFRVVRSGNGFATEDVWHTDEVLEGALVGLSHLNSGQYFALDLETGEVIWRSDPRQAENAAMVRAGDKIFSLEDDAELVVLQNVRQGFEPIRRYKVATTATWTQPAISGNQLFVKDVSSLILWALE
jgi:outer membrane protein assembly factor BamB